MSDLSFLAVIKGALEDHTPRLIYADWLDERGDPRGSLIRIEEDNANGTHLRRPLLGVEAVSMNGWLGKPDKVLRTIDAWCAQAAAFDADHRSTNGV